MFPADLIRGAATLSERLRGRGLMLVTAESCTGGLIAGLLTELSGSSEILERGFVTYSNRAKETELGVSPLHLETHGAVSELVARGMAEGAVKNSEAHVSVAVTGVAGPGGGSIEKPVGLVHIASHFNDMTLHRECRFGDVGRSEIRLDTIRAAFELVAGLIDVADAQS